jgi:N-acetylglucosaminyldiphosphoundecaprenol N-acetyl-beta-D-mannosaminyltransferase
MCDRPEHLRVGSTRIDFVPLADAAEAICRGEYLGGVHLCNAYTVALAAERPDLAEVLAADSANLPDGMPLVWCARRRGLDRAQRVYGPDLMEAVLDRGRNHAVRHYLYGSTPEVLASLEMSIARRWPGAEVVGSESPPFRDLSDDELRGSVEAAAFAGAGVVWVGMGTPKQDLLVHRMAELGDATYVAIGAAFDFIAGTKRQAPRWVMRIGMEWFFRLLSEPSRLWKRYLVYNARFLRSVWLSRRSSIGDIGP